jgi:hypothetical protein
MPTERGRAERLDGGTRPASAAQGGCESPSDLMEARDQPLLLKVGVRAPLT